MSEISETIGAPDSEVLKLDDELFAETQPEQGGQLQSTAPVPVESEILRDFLLGHETADDGGEDDGS